MGLFTLKWKPAKRGLELFGKRNESNEALKNIIKKNKYKKYYTKFQVVLTQELRNLMTNLCKKFIK